jgi:hypothetical protein
MKLRSITGKFILLFAVLFVSASATPRLAIPDSAFNFGLVPQNAKVNHTFWLYSMGTDSLKFLKIDPGCGCTQAPLQKTDLAPGDSTALDIIFSTGHYSGKQSKYPGMQTNEGSEIRYLQFMADVFTKPDSTYPIVFMPYKFDISQYGEKDRPYLEFTVKNISNQPVGISLIDAPPDMFKIHYPKKLKPGQTGKGKIEIAKAFVGHEFEKSITFQFSDKDNTHFTIPVRRVIRIPEADSTGSAGK